MTFVSIVVPLSVIAVRVIFSGNRLPLFGIARWRHARKFALRCRRSFGRTWAKPLTNKGDFVNLVNKALTPQRSAGARGIRVTAT
jgi:hypothetical protein